MLSPVRRLAPDHAALSASAGAAGADLPAVHRADDPVGRRALPSVSHRRARPAQYQHADPAAQAARAARTGATSAPPR